MATEVRRLPGDRVAATRRMIRVDQAGEYGAARIYAGQLAVMGGRARELPARSATWPRRNSAISMRSTR